jgi:single-strand DNA-binding protein
MPNLNKVMIMGNLTRDPELKYTPKGTAVADVSLAINRVYSTDQGERREETTYVDVELWGRQAEIAGEYLRKGRPVYIEGRLKLDTWDDKQSGQKRSKMRVVGEAMQLLGGREGGNGGGGSGSLAESGEFAPAPRSSQRPQGRAATPTAKPVDPDLDVEGDEVPF